MNGSRGTRKNRGLCLCQTPLFGPLDQPIDPRQGKMSKDYYHTDADKHNKHSQHYP